jgi:pimeloyl-ACP methyl ester carboxylesterase
VNDVDADPRALAGRPTTYEYGVLQAMRAAGVTAGDDVTLVGHSQGGVVAVNTAKAAAQSGEFTITHVITAGAPIGVAARGTPTSVQVLAIENAHDVIPKLDGAANPAPANITTVTVDHDHESVGRDHGLAESYGPTANDLDSSDDIDVRSYLDGEAGLFGQQQQVTERYSITTK